MYDIFCVRLPLSAAALLMSSAELQNVYHLKEIRRLFIMLTSGFNINVLLYPSFNIFFFFTCMVKLWSTIINLFNADGLLCTVYIALLTSKWTLFAPLFYSFSLFSSCPFVLLSFLPRLLNYWLVWRLWRWGSVDGLGQCWVVLSCWRECRPVLHINPFNGSASSGISQWFMSHCF